MEMDREEMMAHLVRTGKQFLGAARRALERGEAVNAVMAMATAEGKLNICMLPFMPPTSEQRAALLRSLIKKTNAVGFCFLSDVYMLDPKTLERIGESLSVIVQVEGIANGVGIHQDYTRDPLIFKEIWEGESGMAEIMFDSQRVH